jgi:hypothetical protein
MSFTLRPSIILGSLAIAMLVGIGIYLAPLKPNILCLQFAISESQFHAVLSKWKPAGVALYENHFPADFLFIAFYATFGYCYARERTSALRSRPLLLPMIKWALPLAAVADVAEDLLHILLLSSVLENFPMVYLMSGISASLKWLGIIIFIVGFFCAMKKCAG